MDKNKKTAMMIVLFVALVALIAVIFLLVAAGSPNAGDNLSGNMKMSTCWCSQSECESACGYGGGSQSGRSGWCTVDCQRNTCPWYYVAMHSTCW